MHGNNSFPMPHTDSEEPKSKVAKMTKIPKSARTTFMLAFQFPTESPESIHHICMTKNNCFPRTDDVSDKYSIFFQGYNTSNLRTHCYLITGLARAWNAPRSFYKWGRGHVNGFPENSSSSTLKKTSVFWQTIDAQFDSLGVPQTVQEMNLIKIRTLQLLSSVGSHFDSHQVSSTFAVGFSRSHHP